MARAILGLLLSMGTHVALAQEPSADPPPIEIVEHSELGGSASAEVEVGSGEVELGWLGLVFDVELLGVGIYAPPVRAQLNLALFVAVAWHPWLEIGLYSGVFGVAPRTDTTYRVGGQVRINVPIPRWRRDLDRFLKSADSLVLLLNAVIPRFETYQDAQSILTNGLTLSTYFCHFGSR